MTNRIMQAERSGEPAYREDRILIDEVHHRTANEVAAAIAAMRIARRAEGPQSRANLIDRAIDRLEAFGECSRLFSVPVGKLVDAGALLDTMCRTIVRSRHDGPSKVILDIPPAVVEGVVARRIVMIAYELVNNALKHAFFGRGGELAVRLERLAGDLVLSVIDDGPGLGQAKPAGTPDCRLGGAIVEELIRAANGAFDCETGPDGTAVHVVVPLDPAIPASTQLN